MKVNNKSIAEDIGIKNMKSNCSRALLFCCGIAVAMLGCSGSAANMAPVSGKVTIKGAPVDGALVVFHPLAPGKVNNAKPLATTGPDGAFQLTTFALNDGAEIGDYGVTIVWNKARNEKAMALSSEGDPGGPDRLQGRYGNPAMPKLKAKVEAGSNLCNFEVE